MAPPPATSSAAAAPASPAKEGNFVRDVLLSYGTNVINIVLTTAGGILTARMLGPHQRGIYALVYIFAATVVTFGKLGIAQANVYSIRREKVPPEKVAANALISALVLGAFLALGAFLLRDRLLETFLKGVPVWAFYLSLPLIPVLLFESYFNAVVQALGHFGLYNRRMLIGTISLVSGLFLFLLFVPAAISAAEARQLSGVVTALGWLPAGLTAAILVVTINPVFMDTWLLVTVWRMLRFRLRLDTALLAREVRFGLKSHLQVVAQHLHLRADVYLLAFFLDPAQVAFYVLAAKFVELMLDIPKSIGMVMYPRLASLDDAAMYRLTAQACRRTILVTGLVGVVISLLGPFVIVLWYGEAYRPAGEPLPLLALGVLMMSMMVLLTQSFTSRNRQQVNIVVGALALVANVGLNSILIPSLGLKGAALASCLSYGGASLLLLAAFCLSSRLSPFQVILPRPDDLRFFLGLALNGVEKLRSRRATLPSGAR